MYLIRAFAVWLLIIFAESIHGALRQMFLTSLGGDFPMRQIAFFIGVLLIFLIAYLCIRWIAVPNVKSLFAVGFLWMILTAVFEFGLGYFILGYSFERIFEDYDFSHGGLMGFGLLFMVFVPFLVAKMRKII